MSVGAIKDEPDLEGPAHVSPSIAVETDEFVYETEADSEEFKRSFAAAYLTRPKPKAIFAMTVGMPEFAGILDRPPISILKRKDLNDAYVPKAEDFKQEVKRRAHFFMNVEEEADYHINELKTNHPLKTRRNKIVIPQPNQWLNTNLKAWLSTRPMKPNEKDTEFVRAEIKKFLEFLGNESMIEAAEAAIAAPTTPKVSLLSPVATPVASSLNLPTLPVDEHCYTSVNDSESYKRSAALTYSKLASKPRVVIAMALGMHEYQGMLERPPFSLATRKDMTDDYIPRAEDYRYEIKRRAHFFMNVEEEADYFLKELKKKHPLENMRGVVQLPQPAQWKIASLRGWLTTRPLRPTKEDSTFISESMQIIMDSLQAVLAEQKAKEEISKKSSGPKMPWGTGGDSTARGGLIHEAIHKSDAVLEAVSKQNKSQAIVNKITILNQTITGYQQDISSLRSTLNDIANRILTIEMKIAENPDSTERMSKLIADQQASKEDTENKIKGIEDLIAETREQIADMTKEMEELSAAAEESVTESGRKRKLEESSATPENEEIAEI
jgi:hypothetical protein